jgi:hypothetical protein
MRTEDFCGTFACGEVSEGAADQATVRDRGPSRLCSGRIARRATSQAEDYAPPADDIAKPLLRQAFQRPHTSLGSLGLAGHWVGLIGGLLPLALSELIAEPAKYRKAVRFASIGTTVAYEVLYTVHELNRRKEQEAKLAECRSGVE